MAKDYELLEHTADISIRVRAKTKKALFNRVALAMFDIIAAKRPFRLNFPQKIQIKQQAGNLEELLVNWLNELLSLSAIKELVFFKFKINRLEDNFIEAVALGNNINNYQPKTEIKAATYHELKAEKVAFGWQAEVIFDV